MEKRRKMNYIVLDHSLKRWGLKGGKNIGVKRGVRLDEFATNFLNTRIQETSFVHSQVSLSLVS